MLDSLSKRYSLCGDRLGVFISLNKKIIASILRLAQGRLSSGYIDQIMASKLNKVPDSYFDRIKKEYEKRRDVVYQGLININGITVSKPEGAFYTIVDLPVKNAENFCQWLLTDFRLHNETVMLAPASGFYATPHLGHNQVRIAAALTSSSSR